jgi:hypothetical protein
MFSNLWGRAPKAAFHDKAFTRAALPDWDRRWHDLSPAARAGFLDHVKIPARGNPSAPGVPAARFPPAALDDLVAAGFLSLQQQGRPPRPHAVLARDALDFTKRLRALRRYHLLAEDRPPELGNYVNYCFARYDLQDEIRRVLRKADRDTFALIGDVFELYVARRRWPGWVVQALDDPLARSVLDVVQGAAGGRLPLAEVAAHLPPHDPAAVRAALEKLITRLALFEDLDPATHDLLVGLLPAVRADIERASRPRARPPLVEYPSPKDVGPEGGFEVPDLRDVLLELAGAPARLRRDDTLFQKETDRFLVALTPLPSWLVDRYELDPEERLEDALDRARTLGLVTEKEEGESTRLRLSPRGHQWLASPLEKQYAEVYAYQQGSARRSDSYDFYDDEGGDSLLLGSRITSVPAGKGRPAIYTYEAYLKPEQKRPLREALRAAFHELAPGAFYRLDDFVAHTVFGRHNPLLLGREPNQVTVRVEGRLLPPDEDQLEEAARQLLDDLVDGQLIPLGGLQAAVDSGGRLLIARQPRLDVYFGAPPEETEPAAESVEAPRVVVQPDFSIIVIGLDPTPIADLAPFCERVKGRAGQGAVTFKISRESVVKAVANGLKPAEILARLEHHSSNPLPGNVAHEVRAWSDWVRQVSADPVTVFRCPDAATADRVLAALGRQAERLNPTTVAFPEERLLAAERKKLLGQGILVTTGRAAPGRRKKR